VYLHDIAVCLADCGTLPAALRRAFSGYGGLGVGMLAYGTQVRGFEPGRSRSIFQGEKSPQHAYFQRGSKAVGHMSQICGM
jgi:hypothetical protein